MTRHGANLPTTRGSEQRGSYSFITGAEPKPNEIFVGHGRDRPEDREKSLALLSRLAKRMNADDALVRLQAADPRVDSLDNPTIPAGYTYFGQLIAHDVTFDPTPLPSSSTPPGTLGNLRTSALDLDCIYGGGPDKLPMLYSRRTDGQVASKRTRLRLGETGPVRGHEDQHVPLEEDLPRIRTSSPANSLSDTPAGGFDTGFGNALHVYESMIADPRNEDNLILLHLVVLFHKLHNILAGNLEAGDGSNPDIFGAARAVVLRIYRTVIVDDFLARLLDPAVHEHYSGKTRLADFKFMAPLTSQSGRFPIPIEFSAAVFRVGHIMAQDRYRVQTRSDVAQIPGPLLGVESSNLMRLMSFQGEPPAPMKSKDGVPLTNPWVLELRDFFWDVAAPDGPSAGNRNSSRRLTPAANDVLSTAAQFEPSHLHRPLAVRNFADPSFGALIYRDLARSFDLGLPSGQTLARAFGVPVLQPNEIASGLLPFGVEPDHLSAPFDSEEVWLLSQNTPLFYYVLREAEIQHRGERLGSLGSSVVAEVVFAALRAADETTPELSNDIERLTAMALGDEPQPRSMLKLVEFVERNSNR